MQFIKKYWEIIVAVIFILATFFLAYRPTLFDFIVGDDFLNLTWAQAAVKQPELLLERFFGSWQGWFQCLPRAEYDLVYRPLYRAIFYLGYQLWGSNSFYYRLLNITTELLSGLALFFLVVSISRKSIKNFSLTNHQSKIWAFLAGSLFILYPLHSEPVNWITDLMDPLVTLFFLLTILFYGQWREKSKWGLLFLSILSAIMAFLTKEMAVAIPITIFLYELLIVRNFTQEGEPLEAQPALIKNVKRSALFTCPYWLILILYFCWRKVLLGDFIGGYPDSSFYPTITGWVQGLRDIFIPINTLIIGTHSLTFKIWHIVSIVLVSLTVYKASKSNKEERNALSFLCLWFIISLAPVYKIFSTLMSCATGSRLAYLSTAPICILLTYGLSKFCSEEKFLNISRVFALVALLTAGKILYTNNLAWEAAGNLSNNVVRQIRSYYEQKVGDPFMYITGLPTNHKSGIFSVPSLGQITKTPTLIKDFSNCARLDSNEQFLNSGFIKHSINRHQKQIDLFYWDSDSNLIKPVIVPQQNLSFGKKWHGESLKEIIRISPLSTMPKPKIIWRADGTLQIKSLTDKITFVSLDLSPKNLPCWSSDGLILNTQFIHAHDFGVFGQTELLFTNKIAKNFTREYRPFNSCHAGIRSSMKEQRIIFPLRDLPTWAMGGNCTGLRITLPIEDSVLIKEISIPETASIVPQIDLDSLPTDPPGRIRLTSRVNSASVSYDNSKILHCANTRLEIVPASENLRAIESNSYKGFLLKQSECKIYGQFQIRRNQFPADPAVYKAQIRALDAYGTSIGLTSDVFFIFVDP